MNAIRMNRMTGLLGAPSPEEGLRILRCYKEHIIISVEYREDTWGPKYNSKTKVLVTKTEYGGLHQT